MFTEAQIRSFLKPTVIEPSGRLHCGDGLWLDIASRRVGVWVYRYRVGKGTRKKVVLGEYPKMSLSAALAKQLEIVTSLAVEHAA